MLFILHTQKGFGVMQRKRKVKTETDSKADESETKTGDRTTEPEIKRRKMTTHSDLPKHEKKRVFLLYNGQEKSTSEANIAQQSL